MEIKPYSNNRLCHVTVDDHHQYHFLQHLLENTGLRRDWLRSAALDMRATQMVEPWSKPFRMGMKQLGRVAEVLVERTDEIQTEPSDVQESLLDLRRTVVQASVEQLTANR